MSIPTRASPPNPPFSQSTSVMLHGSPEAVVDWVALAFASAAPGGYHWTDVRGPGQAPDPSGPLARGAIPPSHLRTRDPQELTPDNVAANAAIASGVLREGESTQLKRLADFLRLPAPTRRFVVSREPGSAPLVLVVSNARQLVPLYSVDVVRTLLETLVTHGLVVLATYPGAASKSRFVFENVWRLDAVDLALWRSAKLEVEQASPSGPISMGSPRLLEGLPFVNAFLTQALEPPP